MHRPVCLAGSTGAEGIHVRIRERRVPDLRGRKSTRHSQVQRARGRHEWAGDAARRDHVRATQQRFGTRLRLLRCPTIKRWKDEMGLHHGVVGCALQCEIEELPDTRPTCRSRPDIRACTRTALWLCLTLAVCTTALSTLASELRQPLTHKIAGRSQPAQSAPLDIGIGAPEAERRQFRATRRPRALRTITAGGTQEQQELSRLINQRRGRKERIEALRPAVCILARTAPTSPRLLAAMAVPRTAYNVPHLSQQTLSNTKSLLRILILGSIAGAGAPLRCCCRCGCG